MSCLTYLKKIRNSIMPKNIKDIGMVNAHSVMLYHLSENKIDCNILKNYIENREMILSAFGENKNLLKTIFKYFKWWI